MSRLDALLHLRQQLDLEIDRERRAIARIKALRTRVHVATTRGSWSQRVMKAACQHYGVTEEAVRSSRRDQITANARHTAMWLMRDANRSYAEIGRELDVDHTTVMHGVKRIEKTPDLLAIATSIRTALTGEEAASA